MERANLIISILLFCFAAFVLILALNLPEPPDLGTGMLGPEFFPLVLVGLLVLLTGILLAGQMREWKRNGRKSGEEEWLPRGEAFQRIAFVLGGLLLYIILLGVLGYIAATAIFLAVLIRALERYRMTLILTVGLFAAIGLWAVFGWWIKVPLPKGPWGF